MTRAHTGLDLHALHTTKQQPGASVQSTSLHTSGCEWIQCESRMEFLAGTVHKFRHACVVYFRRDSGCLSRWSPRKLPHMKTGSRQRLIPILTALAALTCAASRIGSLTPVTAVPLEAAGTSCANLRTMALGAGHIDTVQVVEAGALPAQRARRLRSPYAKPPGLLPGGRDADAVGRLGHQNSKSRLPATGWNNKLQAVGNGGWAGTISYGALASAVSKGTPRSRPIPATPATAPASPWATPRSSSTTPTAGAQDDEVTGKAIIERFYGGGPRLSYFNGCSTGGRQALIEASRFPNDFDGIIAGAAANPKAHLDAWRIQMAQAMFTSQESAVPPAKQEVLYKAVVAACDAIDGATDGLIENPTQCRFDPGTLQCRAGDDPSCLTAAQVKTVGQSCPTQESPDGGNDLPHLPAGHGMGLDAAPWWSERL